MGAALQRHAMASGIALVLCLPLVWWIRPQTSGGVTLLIAIVLACVNLGALLGKLLHSPRHPRMPATARPSVPDAKPHA